MKRLRCLTHWVGTGTQADPRRPAFADAYPTLKWEDVTGQPSGNLPTAPNVLCVDVEVTDAVAAQVLADPAYDGAILFGTDSPDSLSPSLTQLNRLKTWLQNKGMTLAQLAAVVGSDPSVWTRRTLAAALRAWLKGRPRQ